MSTSAEKYVLKIPNKHIEVGLKQHFLYQVQMLQTQLHSLKQITSNLCLHEFLHFLRSASEDCLQATNWTAEHARRMAYASPSNDPRIGA